MATEAQPAPSLPSPSSLPPVKTPLQTVQPRTHGTLFLIPQLEAREGQGINISPLALGCPL